MVANMTKQDGLDAAGFLLLAEAHLVRAREILAKRPGSCPYLDTKHAISTIRLVLNQLKYEKEEPSGWDLPEKTDEWGQGYGRCPKCGTPWDIIRPGKGQPACECEEEPCKP